MYGVMLPSQKEKGYSKCSMPTPKKPTKPIEPKRVTVSDSPGCGCLLIAGVLGVIFGATSIGYSVFYIIITIMGLYGFWIFTIKPKVEDLQSYSERKNAYLKDLDLYFKAEKKYQADLIAYQNQLKEVSKPNEIKEIQKTILKQIIIIAPILKYIEVFSVKRVKNNDSEFIVITVPEGDKAISLFCSISQYENMGIADKLPVGITGKVEALIEIVEIPADGNIYGYINEDGNVIEYQKQGRYQLVTIHRVIRDSGDINYIYELKFKQKFGLNYNPHTATDEQRKFFMDLILKNIEIEEESTCDEKSLVSNKTSIEWLRNKGVKFLYHFTDKSNVELIKSRGGLYSWFYLVKNRLDTPKSGGNITSKRLDLHHKLEDYVRTSICKNHPMAHNAKEAGRINDFVILKIDLDALLDATILFSDMNATANDHQTSKSIAVCEKIDFGIFEQPYYSLSDINKKYYQAEVLFKEHIPLKYINFD